MASEEATEFFLKWNSHHNVLVTVLESLLSNQKLVDVTLVAEGKRINVHRVVLFACSSYFEEMLSEQQSEFRQPIIYLKDVSFSNLTALVDYMYKGEVQVAEDQLKSFLHTAEGLQIKGLALVDKEKFSIPPPSPQQKSTSRQYNSINSYLTKNTIPLQSTPIPRKSTSKPQNNNPSSPIRKRVPTSSVPKKPQEKVARGKPSVESKQQRKKLHLDDDDDNYLPSGMVNGHDTSMNSSRSVSRKRTGKSWVQQETEDAWSDSQEEEEMGDTNGTPNIIIVNTTTLANDNGSSHGDDSASNNRRSARKRRPSVRTGAMKGIQKSTPKTSPKLDCPNCGRKYKSKETLGRHMRQECGVDPVYRCSKCEYKTNFKSNLHRHLTRQTPCTADAAATLPNEEQAEEQEQQEEQEQSQDQEQQEATNSI